ncbi:class I SAM-dependent methyltransferase [Xylophilus sp. ASV27]|uniref:class I SAM-dependent methyltransferase n=1 Tax=Xylophilus sp. ASV27 TaxID=2795129 RepID=UPI0018EE1785|nr:class I SAM-dependent methyltransferase [Xylophilus sp. ASV27]
MRRPLPWPLPALLVWASAWALFWLLPRGLPAVLAATAWGAGWSLVGATRMRRLLLALGFPLSLLASGAAALPPWGWLPPLALCLLVYPVHAWRDAPLFPTPLQALDGLPARLALPAGAAVLDAGCGLGDGLRALRRAYPHARLHGIEWSWPLRLACALRCPWARVRRGDIWQSDWSGYALVYLFQRPESMQRAWRKAAAEMPAGAWLASLEFEVPGVLPDDRLQTPDGRPLWLYRVSGKPLK